MTSDPIRHCREWLALLADLDTLDDPEAAHDLADRLRGHLFEAARHGLDGGSATRLLSECNDRLTVRLIELTARRHRLPPVSWCWIALGSEGRYEQTFVTDQDNGLVFSAASDREAEALRPLFLPFAQEVNRRLAECGFKLCEGGVMAGNPAWCLSLDEWREQFIDWIRKPEPVALLNASIFFDMRPLFGDKALVEQLRSTVLGMTVATPSFLHLMANNALQAEVPLNFRGDLAPGERDCIDLKKYGSRIFVDAARIFALAAGATEVNTSARLFEAGMAIGMPTKEIEALDAAFRQILRLRLEHQLATPKKGEAAGSGPAPADLHDMDRAILREALKLAKRLQQRLKLNYAL